ncbi:MAG: hypothetical protein RMJ39_10730 [Deltaproteobacteria bacterium]|nr:hypothetical protein [Deltaproteobacteria bacterium]
MGPLKTLLGAARKVQKVKLFHKHGGEGKNEIGILQQIFEEMIESIKEREGSHLSQIGKTGKHRKACFRGGPRNRQSAGWGFDLHAYAT